jgi:hypothetical protein
MLMAGYCVENCGRRTPGSASTDSKISGTVVLLVNAGTHTGNACWVDFRSLTHSLTATHYAPVESPSIGSRRVRRSTTTSIFVGSLRSCHNYVPHPNGEGTASFALCLRYARSCSHFTSLFDIRHQQQHPHHPAHYFPCTRISITASADSAAQHFSSQRFR